MPVGRVKRIYAVLTAGAPGRASVTLHPVPPMTTLHGSEKHINGGIKVYFFA